MLLSNGLLIRFFGEVHERVLRRSNTRESVLCGPWSTNQEMRLTNLQQLDMIPSDASKLLAMREYILNLRMPHRVWSLD